MSSVLIVEDDHPFSNMMALILQMEGFEVRVAADGAAGLAAIREMRPDLVLCDIMMPGTDGHTLLAALMADVTLSGIPFIFVSALGGRDEVRRGMAAGADDYLPKPFSAEELVAAVVGRLRRHSMVKMHHAHAALPEEASSLLARVTPREHEVLLMVGRGLTSKEIANILGVCLKTVEAHRANLMRKLEAANAVELARWAVLAEQTLP